MTNKDIILLYEAMSAITGEMLTAARAGDWELLMTLEPRCSKHVQTLKDEEQPPALSSPEREQTIKIIQKILEDDLAIRKLADARMAQLSSLMNSTKTERKLIEAYT